MKSEELRNAPRLVLPGDRLLEKQHIGILLRQNGSNRLLTLLPWTEGPPQIPSQNAHR